MKLFELESVEQKNPPIVYVDMDGVLADMFGQVAKHHGVSHWRKARKVGKVEQVAKHRASLVACVHCPKLARLSWVC